MPESDTGTLRSRQKQPEKVYISKFSMPPDLEVWHSHTSLLYYYVLGLTTQILLATDLSYNFILNMWLALHGTFNTLGHT